MSTIRNRDKGKRTPIVVTKYKSLDEDAGVKSPTLGAGSSGLWAQETRSPTSPLANTFPAAVSNSTSKSHSLDPQPILLQTNNVQKPENSPQTLQAEDLKPLNNDSNKTDSSFEPAEEARKTELINKAHTSDTDIPVTNVSTHDESIEETTGEDSTKVTSQESDTTVTDNDNMVQDSSDNMQTVSVDVEGIKDGDMKEVEIGDNKALLVKDNGIFYAIGATCSHYAAPLIKGVLCNGHVRCPWHGACFNIQTGDIEDYPGLDSIPTFDVKVTDGKVQITADPRVISSPRRCKTMSTQADDDDNVILIVGGGPAGLTCAETLRQEGYKGHVVMVTKDKHLPYDRPKLSKMMKVTPEKVILRDQDFYTGYGIKVHLENEVLAIDTENKKIILKDNSSMKYDKLLIAPGTVARHLMTTPGHDLENIHTLRTLDDASAIAGKAQHKDVVIIGTSFIGVETAASLCEIAKSVTIVDLVEAPFQLALGKEVGVGVKQLLQSYGVQFYFKNCAKEFVGTDGRLTEVVLQDETKLKADLCIVGIGVIPATDFLKSSTLTLTDRGFVSVDKQMRTNEKDVFAAGDATHFPLFMAGDDNVNIQHWQMAHQQGRIAALNMLDKAVAIKSVPFFWTVLFGKSIRYTGYGFGYDDIVMHGSSAELNFVAYYTKGENVIAVATMGRDPIAAHVAEAFLSEIPLTKSMVMDSSDAWLAKL